MSSFEACLAEALARERAGEWAAAEIAFTETFNLSIHTGDIAEVVDALRGLCRVYQQQQRYEEAEELGDLSFEIASRNDLRGAAARATNSLAAIQYHQQHWDGARSLYQSARKLALDIGDDTLAGETCQNLGIIANILGDVREARVLYLESLGSTARSGDRRTAMMAYNNLAMSCADLHDWIEAEIYFDRGIEVAELLKDVPMAAKLQANRAEPLIRTGQFSEARKALATAERLAGSIREVATLADAARFRSMIAREECDLEAAAKHITYSLQLAAEAGLNLERAEALEELACLLSAEGQNDKAVATLSEAHERYEALGAKRDAARTLDVLENWSSRTSTAASTLPEVVP